MLQARVRKLATPRTLRQLFATHLLQATTIEPLKTFRATPTWRRRCSSTCPQSLWRRRAQPLDEPSMAADASDRRCPLTTMDELRRGSPSVRMPLENAPRGSPDSGTADADSRRQVLRAAPRHHRGGHMYDLLPLAMRGQVDKLSGHSATHKPPARLYCPPQRQPQLPALGRQVARPLPRRLYEHALRSEPY